MQQQDARTSGLLDDAVRASNALTTRWASRVEGADFVLSGAGVWPLLALLASGAAGPARDELVEAVGLPAESAQEAAVALLECLATGSATSAALGLWVHDRITLLESWTKRLPVGVVGRLSGPEAQGRLDAWAAEHTRGLIEKFPLEIEPNDDLMLATALAARTKWTIPFDDLHDAAGTGAWADRQIPILSRYGALAGTAVIKQPDGVTTRVIVAGQDDLDVHLVIGAVDAPAGSVLGAGIAALSPACTVIPAEDLPNGFTDHGISVREIMATTPWNRLGIHVPPFTVRSRHDLCSPPTLFGLTTAMKIDPFGHFPHMSEHPQFVKKGAQDIVVAFSATGFEAAAVSAFGMIGGGMPEFSHRMRLVEVSFDRPFGFIAVHRPTGLVVVAGWVGTAPEAHA
ncbi:serpin family protein [Pseudonocardia sp. TRM90224]|uniref:serpin family protein n=1 Tax=Pseudonocardia sp. TRM90224 TaxID=2812678 RepID=UPI001E30A8C2|nr:serpin family protein [Pseudonocardia sp. TRM90224]